jgi:hypothetical protein
MTFAERVPDSATPREESWSRSSFFWDTFPFRPPNATWVASSGFGRRSTIESESSLVSESPVLPLGN